ncbi:MAG TPA: ABC transporter ATP-binding protein [Anaerolineae bacterium]|nr:ABC transporter ATP-binding protein [Anaerolineae bacterium]
MTNKVLEVKNLTVDIEVPAGTLHAVSGIDFYVDQGETLCIVGESGCGKSITALAVMDLLPRKAKLTADRLNLQGRDLLTLPKQEFESLRGDRMAMIFQDPMTSLNPVMSIGRQITEMLELHMAMNRKQARERAAELLSMVGIPRAADRLDDYPHQFSGGMRQRVMIAMALSCAPQILIADEPTTALDVTIQAQIVDLVKRLRDELGMAIVWITHDLGVVARLVANVIVMYAGYIIERAPVKELYAQPSHPYTLGLLGSLPRLDELERRRLVSIEGAPPDLVDLPQGCPFAARCPYVIERCRQENPPLRSIGPDHEVACWYDVPVGRPR